MSGPTAYAHLCDPDKAMRIYYNSRIFRTDGRFKCRGCGATFDDLDADRDDMVSFGAHPDVLVEGGSDA